MEFVIGKRKVELSKEKVVEALKGLEPEPLRGRARYYVELDGKKYPVKQVMVAVTGLSKESFATDQAVKLLRALGFEVKDLRKERRLEVLSDELEPSRSPVWYLPP
jgi:5-methylcytosine-specific restriction protein B